MGVDNQNKEVRKFKLFIKNSEIPDFVELRMKENFAIDFKTIKSEFTLKL